jgi:hypothetical protein
MKFIAGLHLMSEALFKRPNALTPVPLRAVNAAFTKV